MEREAENLLKRLAEEDREYFRKVKCREKRRNKERKQILKAAEGRRRFFRRRMISAGYEDGKYFGLDHLGQECPKYNITRK